MSLTRAVKRERHRSAIGPGSADPLMTPERFESLRLEQFVGRNRYEVELLEINVQEYGIIDRFRSITTVYRQRVSGPESEVIIKAQTYKTKLLPGLVLPPARLRAQADQMQPTKNRPQPFSEPKCIPPAGGING